MNVGLIAYFLLRDSRNAELLTGACARTTVCLYRKLNRTRPSLSRSSSADPAFHRDRRAGGCIPQEGGDQASRKEADQSC
jgi:hypothetical protein